MTSYAGTTQTIILGNEYDDSVRAALREALISLGATGISSDWGAGGSQEIERVEVIVNDKPLVIEAETYIGLTITGEKDLMTRVNELVKTNLSRAPDVTRG